MAEDEGDPALREERLYDEYLELALAGEPPGPEQFLAERGGGGAELCERLRGLQRAAISPAGFSNASGAELPFETLGEYRLIERIGRGGMGLVFLAEQPLLERRVALKVLRPELAGSTLAAERFKREARTIAKLRHPGIVALFGFGEDRGVRFLAMEYLPGRTLEEELRAGPVPLARRVRWIRDIARALDYAHREGVVHRDVKPSNIRITPDDRALLVDFGLVRSTNGESATLTDTFAGSPSYASPEQIRSSASVDARTDVYSLGVMLYRCATGKAPFEGDSVEQLLHRILDGEYTPPRRLDPSLPRDLELVTSKAMERDPARRYASAGELAEDLDAVLELRPVRAHPPGPLERALRAARRNRVAAASLMTGAVALLAFASYSLITVRRERAARELLAASTVEEARRRVESYRASRRQVAGLQYQVAKLAFEIEYQPLSPDQYRLLDEREAEVAAHERAWQTAFHEVLDLLREAERLDPEVSGAERVRAEIYRERYEEAVDALRPDEAEVYRALVVEHDPEGPLSAELRGDCDASFTSDPPGATVYLFQLAEQAKLFPGGEVREVPVPFGDDAPPARPGTWALRVLADRGALRAGDHVVELAGRPIEGTVFVARDAPGLAFLDRVLAVDGLAFDDAWAVEKLGPPQVPGDGGEPPLRTFEFERSGAPAGERIRLRARGLADLGVVAETPEMLARRIDRPVIRCKVARDGELLDLDLAPGVETRTTAAPFFPSPRCAIGVTPIASRPIPRGDHVALVRLPGYEDLRLSLGLVPGKSLWHAKLLPLGTTPAGFVRLPPHPRAAVKVDWIQEREVTAAEYLEFLNDPETLAEIARAEEAIRFPREGPAGRGHPLWNPGPGGSWAIPDDWRADYPVVGISWFDAVAYARWRSQRESARGGALEFTLPDREAWQYAGLCTLRRHYTWGVRFRPKWARTCFARQRADLGGVLQFPVDESVLGVYDLCGGAGEWLDTWYDEGRNMRHLAGGAWGQSHAETTRVLGGNGYRPDQTSGETGFRLVARPRDPR